MAVIALFCGEATTLTFGFLIHLIELSMDEVDTKAQTGRASPSPATSITTRPVPATPSAAAPPPIFELPLELRQHIYALAIGDLQPIPPWPKEGIKIFDNFRVIGDAYRANRASENLLRNLFNTNAQIRADVHYLLGQRYRELLSHEELAQQLARTVQIWMNILWGTSSSIRNASDLEGNRLRDYGKLEQLHLRRYAAWAGFELDWLARMLKGPSRPIVLWYKSLAWGRSTWRFLGGV